MASSFTTNHELEKPGQGEQKGVWAITLNRNIDKMDAMISRVLTVDVTSNQTITTSRSAVADFNSAIIHVTGNLNTVGANRTVTLPDGKSGQWIIDVSEVTFSNRHIVFKTATQTNGVTITSTTEKSIIVYSNGSSVKRVGNEPDPYIIGEIRMYQPPTGVLVSADLPSGWHLCDGNNGTVDMRNRFPLGASNANIGTPTGGASSGSISLGTFTYSGTTGSTALSLTQIPAHRHQVFSGTLGSGGSPSNLNALVAAAVQVADGGNAEYTMRAGTGDATIGRSGSAGSGQGHTHSFSISKSLGSVIADRMPPWRHLLYIQYTGV